MRRRIAGPLAGAAVVILLTAGAADASSWKGRATNEDGDFRFGPVSFQVKGKSIRSLEIEGVTTFSGCGGYMTIVFPRVPIRANGRFYREYEPIPGYDQTNYVWGRLTGSKAKGYFRTFGLCTSVGIFTARKR